MITRALAGLALSLAVALIARRRRALSSGGAVAAVVTGTICTTAGYGWAVLLFGFFASGTSLSAWQREHKQRLTGGLAEKAGERDAWQVLANGGAFTLAATGSLLLPSTLWPAIGAGAIAAATADTWATEIGLLSTKPPRGITTGRLLPAGASGGVTLLGTAAALAGALAIGSLTVAVGWPAAAFPAAVLGGLAGTTADSLLGATVQQKRWCEGCRAMTERQLHGCGAQTQPRSGLAWLGNDTVNAAGSITGAVAGLILVW